MVQSVLAGNEPAITVKVLLTRVGTAFDYEAGIVHFRFRFPGKIHPIALQLGVEAAEFDGRHDRTDQDIIHRQPVSIVYKCIVR